jgi:signal transduction histidine kinase
MKKKKSLTLQLIVTMLLLVAGTVLFCWFLNNTFLERYYTYNKQKQLLNSFQTINQTSNANGLNSEAFDIVFEKICATENVSILIINPMGQVLCASSNDEQQFLDQLTDILYAVSQSETETVLTADDYVLQRQTDNRIQTEYLVLFGVLGDGNYIYMRTALESIRESAAVSNRFFLFVGILATFISVIVIILLSKTISRPIMELSGISERMSELDFDAKYQPKKHSSRELEELGSHMNKLSETLEATISELKAANNELQKDIRKKEQIDEMRREFLSNVSHELKTPLALISGYAEGLREGVNDSEESRNFYCEVITDESEKMNRMVNKLLTLNQLEFGNEKVEMVRFDITELIRGVIASSSLLAQQSGIEIIFDEEKPTYVWGDEFKVEEVVTNYLSNALHYAEGEKKIRISYAFHDNLLRVCVFNTGKPIPEEDIDKIWIKFYKVDKARTREYGGSGIGLSIVKAIMDSLHRECGVINHLDGVEFWMELESELHIDNVSKIW